MIEKLIRLKSVAAPLLENAIDTDVIFPARFLLLPNRDGLGKYAFNERRRDTEPFILDTPPYDTAEILVTGENFGTGSSREQAVWALADLGIRCVIARSFGEIFFANCFKNGVLPIRLEGGDIVSVEQAAKTAEPITVDLEHQRIELADGSEIDFEVDANRKRSLLAGLDEVGMILSDEADAIDAYEAKRANATPWLSIEPERFGDLPKEEDAA